MILNDRGVIFLSIILYQTGTQPRIAVDQISHITLVSTNRFSLGQLYSFIWWSFSLTYWFYSANQESASVNRAHSESSGLFANCYCLGTWHPLNVHTKQFCLDLSKCMSFYNHDFDVGKCSVRTKSWLIDNASLRSESMSVGKILVK